VRGKGIPQTNEDGTKDCSLKNYTVAKALEDCVWSEQTVGEAGVFEQDGVLCKMIACTYFSG